MGAYGFTSGCGRIRQDNGSYRYECWTMGPAIGDRMPFDKFNGSEGSDSISITQT